MKVNSLNLGYDRVAELAKGRKMACLFLRHNFPPRLSAHFCYFHDVPVQRILSKTNILFLSQSPDLSGTKPESSVEELSRSQRNDSSAPLMCVRYMNPSSLKVTELPVQAFIKRFSLGKKVRLFLILTKFLHAEDYGNKICGFCFKMNQPFDTTRQADVE